MNKLVLRPEPWLAAGANRFLAQFLAAAPRDILEFGCGGSTVWFASRCRRLVSIDHDSDWFHFIHNVLNIRKLTADLRLMPRPYAGVCAEFPADSFDFVLVDGRDRVLCLQAAVRLVKPGGVLMLDNWERAKYRKFAPPPWPLTTAKQPPSPKRGWVTGWWTRPL